MALTLTAEIEAALATGHIEAVDVVEIDFGTAKRYWSDRTLSLSVTDGIPYDPRIKTISELPVASSDSDDEFIIELDNSDYYARGLEDKGLRLHRAKVWVHRIFTNLDPPNNKITNYAAGTVVAYPMDARVCKLKVVSGLLALNRQGLWKLEQSCGSLFRDGLRCPYDPLAGKGLPERRFTGTATGGSTTTLVDTAQTFTPVEAGWVVVNLTDKSAGRVKSVAGDTITVESFANGTNNSVTASDSYIVGPEFSSCPKSVTACQERGMFGPNDNQTSADLNKSERRYFHGIARPARVPFKTKIVDSTGKRRGPFTRTAFGNDGLAGTSVPIAFGAWRNRSMIPLGLAFHDAFIESLWIASVGKCKSINSIAIDSSSPDNVNRGLVDGVTGTAITRDSFFAWNFEEPSGSDDKQIVSPSYSGELTEEQRRLGIGNRGCRSRRWRTDLDTYVNNPYLYNNAAGDGVSTSGLAVVRIRTEPSSGVTDTVVPKAGADIVGVACRSIPGSGDATWVHDPNPIQVAYHFLRDTLYGAGLDDAQLDLPTFITASAYCEATVETSQSTRAVIGGYVFVGPEDSDGTSFLGSDFFSTRTNLGIGKYDDDRLVVYTSGGPVARFISGVSEEPIGGEQSDEDNFGETDSDTQGARYWVINFTEAFPAGQMPAAGDQWKLVDETRVPRYRFNGALSEPAPVGEILNSILDNCSGKWVQKNGKIAVVIPAAVTLTTVEADTIFTDKGNLRNIIYRGPENNRKSTVVWEPDDIEDTPNAITVEYSDKGFGYETVRRKVINSSAQKWVADVFGEKRREKEEAVLSLNGTNDAEQAGRLGARKIRDRGPLPGNRANGTLSFEVAVHDAQKLVPYEDVHIVASDVLPGYLPNLWRLVEKEENAEGLTMTTSWRPHYNVFYDDTAEDIGIEDLPKQTEFNPDALPLDVVIESITDKGYPDNEGNYVERVSISYTPPQTTS